MCPVRQICVVADGVAGALVYELVCTNPNLAPITDLILVNSPIAQILAARRMLSVCDYRLFINHQYVLSVYCKDQLIITD